jgi:5-methylcytosine-specific restriction protein A
MPIRPTPKKNKLTQSKVVSWNSTGFKYNSTEWIKLRNHARREMPLCFECLKKDILEPTKIVDHIKPIAEGGDAWDINNLQGLCEACHNKKTAIERNKRK